MQLHMLHVRLFSCIRQVVKDKISSSFVKNFPMICVMPPKHM